MFKTNQTKIFAELSGAWSPSEQINSFVLAEQAAVELTTRAPVVVAMTLSLTPLEHSSCSFSLIQGEELLYELDNEPIPANEQIIHISIAPGVNRLHFFTNTPLLVSFEQLRALASAKPEL